ncbi:MAG: hypothetical protein K0Q46_944 [Rhodococcus erythropolis]|jgi:hypothetical protein|nr:hypothetical protein [Rhodococcus erythropolis]
MPTLAADVEWRSKEQAQRTWPRRFYVVVVIVGPAVRAAASCAAKALRSTR